MAGVFDLDEKKKGGSDAAVIDESLQEESEEDRFNGLPESEAEGEQSSLEKLMKERETLQNVSRKHKKERMARDGASEYEAVESIMGDLTVAKNKAVHQVLKQRRFYETMLGLYAAQLQSVPRAKRMIHLLMKQVGLTMPSIKALEDKLVSAKELTKAEYDKRYDVIINESLKTFVQYSKENVDMLGDRLHSVTTYREGLVNAIEDLQMKANERADFIEETRAKIDAYTGGIGNTQRKINGIKKKGEAKLSNEEHEALRYNNAVLAQCKENRRIGQQSIQDSEKDLQGYHAELMAAKSKMLKAQAMEGKALDSFSIANGNVELLKQYIDQPDIGFLELFAVMERVAHINDGIIEVIKPLDDYFNETFGTLNAARPVAENPELATTLGVYSEKAKKTRNDLVEMYKTKEIA